MDKKMLLDMFIKEGATVVYTSYNSATYNTSINIATVTLSTGEVVTIDDTSIDTGTWLSPLDGLYLCDFVHEDETQVYVIFEYHNCFMSLILRNK